MFFSGERKLLSNENKPSAYFCVICGLSVVIGTYILVIASSQVNAGYADAYSQYANMDEWLSNLGMFPLHWFTLFGVDAQFGMSIFSPESVINIIRMGAAVIIAGAKKTQGDYDSAIEAILKEYKQSHSDNG
jgi:hypothetical protein